MSNKSMRMPFPFAQALSGFDGVPEWAKITCGVLASPAFKNRLL